MGQTVVEKIVERHLATGKPARPVRALDFVALHPTHVMTHDNTSAVLGKFRAIGATRVFDPKQPVFTLDHNIQDTTDKNLTKYREIAAFATEQGIDHYPAGAGIGHQIMVEQGYVTPGSLVVASDSHSNMYGALGALGTPVVRTDAAAIWATGEFWWQVPRSIDVRLEGKLAPGATGKDVIITLCGLFGPEVLNASVEFSGPGVATLSMDERLSIANMSTEWGTLSAWFPVDDVTRAYLANRARRAGVEVVPDRDAVYAGRIVLDLATVTPHVAGPDTVQKIAPLAELAKQQVKIHKAYIVSCVNSRVSDLVAAARVLEGWQVAAGVELYVAAASRNVQDEAERQGACGALLASGAKPLPPGCGPCIGLGTGLLEAGEVGISATNRNFKGRMGSRDAKCYLASPEVVAASAIAGYITGPKAVEARSIEARWEATAAAAPIAETVEIVAGFPARLQGRLLYLPADNLNTDGIYGKDYTYRDDMTPSMMAEVAMENYDPSFREKSKAGDVLVAGQNFGTGSSREQAVTALQHKGIPLVIAASYSQTYLRNAFNNGFLCVENEDLPKRLAEVFAAEAKAGTKTIVAPEPVDIDFTTGTITWRGEHFRFPPLGPVPQSLVVSGGIENQVRRRLGLA